MEKLNDNYIYCGSLYGKNYIEEQDNSRAMSHEDCEAMKDYGPEPFSIDIANAVIQNNNFRFAVWTGKYLQMTFMEIPVGESIGLEMHPTTDQFIRIEQGEGLVQMGYEKVKFNFNEKVKDGYAFIVPAGIWHNLTNTGNIPIKLYSIYAPPNHKKGTAHKTKADDIH